MLRFLLAFLCWSTVHRSWAGQPSTRADSLAQLLAASRPDTNRVNLLVQLAWARTDADPLKGVEDGQQGLRLARRLGFRSGECRALLMLGWAFMRTGNYATAVQTQVTARRLAEAIGYTGGLIHSDNAIGYAHLEQGSALLALRYFRRAAANARQHHDVALLTPILGNIGRAHLELNRPDSAWYYTWQGYQLDLQQADVHSEIGDLSILGDIAARQGKSNQARYYYGQAIRRAAGMPVSYALSRAYLGLARLARNQQPRQALRYARRAIAVGEAGSYAKGVFEASDYLADLYADEGNTAEAYRHLRAAAALRDSLFSQYHVGQVQALTFSEELHQQQLAEQGAQATARRWRIGLAVALLGAIAAALVGYLLISRRHLRREVGFVQERQRMERLHSRAILAAEQNERRRIGADLHDSVGQLLSATKITLGALQRRLHLSDTSQQELFNGSLHMLDEAVREVRSISHNLVPTTFTQHGLVPALRILLDRLALEPNSLRVTLDACALEDPRLDSTQENIIFRILQELIHNVIKHAQATELTVRFNCQPEQLEINIIDNGVGFDAANQVVVPGIGLRNVESRVAYLHGQLAIASRVGVGTTTTLKIPLQLGLTPVSV
ncbi:histidine kinase [Hymenobacter endophyticus]|uniref:Histidine kinase n=1 Tax=Hymenobacter endophyticus TaxID=3076335 RepID=A0ABU3TIX7_9BACT|nr:histidine kinase [Hymenobacter endophyticus]MDU0371321.1 histidine kinase [Hymenobacter endophyticus]